MSILGKTVLVKGDVRALGDLTIEGRVEGTVTGPDYAVTIAESGDVQGDVHARDITVIGRIDGQMVASEVVDIRAAANVSGRIITGRLIINEGATFNGQVEPQHLEAALRVASFNRRKERKEGAT